VETGSPMTASTARNYYFTLQINKLVRLADQHPISPPKWPSGIKALTLEQECYSRLHGERGKSQITTGRKESGGATMIRFFLSALYVIAIQQKRADRSRRTSAASHLGFDRLAVR
jgi:hypothetical protein